MTSLLTFSIAIASATTGGLAQSNPLLNFLDRDRVPLAISQPIQ